MCAKFELIMLSLSTLNIKLSNAPIILPNPVLHERCITNVHVPGAELTCIKSTAQHNQTRMYCIRHTF